MTNFGVPQQQQGKTGFVAQVQDENAILLLNKMANLLEKILGILADSQSIEVDESDIEKDNLE